MFWCIRLIGLPQNLDNHVLRYYFNKFGPIELLYVGSEVIVIYKDFSGAETAARQLGIVPLQSNQGQARYVRVTNFSPEDLELKSTEPLHVEAVCCQAFEKDERFRAFDELLKFISGIRADTISEKLIQNFESEVSVLRGENTGQARVAELLLRVSAALPSNAITSLNKYHFDVWTRMVRMCSGKMLSHSPEKFTLVAIHDLDKLLDRRVIIGRRRRTWER